METRPTLHRRSRSQKGPRKHIYYGHINSLQTVADKDGESQVVVIEFRSPEEAQSALLRDGKYFGEAQIGVERGTDLTVFVTNYPPTAGPDYLRNLFKDCGDIISVRMPSLKGNVRRRFSYVTFRTREASTKATQKHGKLLDGEYKLTAMFSDPSRAKKRDGAVDEGRELHVTNLDTVVTEDELKEVFSKIGPVQRVSIPRNKGGKGYGTAYIELASKEQADKAVAELNSTKFRTSIMTVALSTPVIYKRAAAVSGERNSASPAPSRDHGGDEAMEDANGDSSKSQAREEVAVRSIALLDIPDTDGVKASAGSSKPSFAPSTVRRPVLGKGGAKRGLGFVASKGAAPAKANGAAVSAPPTEKGDAPPKPMKSNAEFKAMFLGGGSTSSTTNGKEDEDAKKKE
ncbi:putative RNA-binding protein like [Verticillium longisporum]|nr:putative RNA-binding protein like [Verticillium longisporum]